MKLKINSMYKISEGAYLIPRSHLSKNKAGNYAVFEKLIVEENGHYVKQHITLSIKEIKKEFDLGTEGVTIL